MSDEVDPIDSMEDKDLQSINRVLSGDVAAFGSVYDAYIEPIYRFVFFRVQNHHVAEDVTSDIFLKALDRIHTYKSNRGSFRTWLYQLARNTIIDYYRTTKQTVSIEEAYDVPSNSHVSVERVDSTLLAEKVGKYLSGFKDVERDILILRIWQEMPYSEIAGIVGKKEDACKKIYIRAIEKIQKIFPPHLATLIFISLLTDL
ncbi:MAG: sigma-70 family RNA polymerase sigma factor [Candidatus Magasanikbacteria bacterium]|nr:sigma-70 family RNA polymerase sigma factor [Candidatus Magasanikbacteria bacterium]